MKTFGLYLSSILAILGCWTIASPAFAGKTTGSTNLTVTIMPVSQFCDLPDQGNLNLGFANKGLQNIGVFNICSNQSSGFDVAVSSRNGGELRSVDNPQARGLEYRVNATSAQAVGGGKGLDLPLSGNEIGNQGAIAAPVKPSTEPVAIYQSPAVFCNAPDRNGCDVGIQWQLTNQQPVPEGTYADTIIYTLSAR